MRFEKLIFETKQLPRLFSFAAAMLSNNESNHMHTCQCRPLMRHMKLSTISSNTSGLQRADSEHIFSRCPQLRSIRQRFDVLFGHCWKTFSRASMSSSGLWSAIFSKIIFPQDVPDGDAGYRSRYLAHAKRALYHLSYTTMCSSKSVLRRCIGQLSLFLIVAWPLGGAYHSAECALGGISSFILLSDCVKDDCVVLCTVEVRMKRVTKCSALASRLVSASKVNVW